MEEISLSTGKVLYLGKPFESEVNFQLHTTLQPKSCHTGCGMIVEISKLPDYFPEGSSKGDKLYTVLTDFGNTFKMTIEELETAYTITGAEKDPQSRFMRQQELLRDAWDRYFK